MGQIYKEGYDVRKCCFFKNLGGQAFRVQSPFWQGALIFNKINTSKQIKISHHSGGGRLQTCITVSLSAASL